MHSYIPQPKVYDESLCGIFARLSNPLLDVRDPTMACPSPLKEEETEAAHDFLTNLIVSQTDDTAVGKLTLMDLTGHVSRGHRAHYYELKAMLYNRYRSFATPILVEMYGDDKGFKVKRIKTKVCGIATAYAKQSRKCETSRPVENTPVGYPKELDSVIENLVKAHNENARAMTRALTTTVPGSPSSGLTGQSLAFINTHESPSQVAQRLHKAKVN